MPCGRHSEGVRHRTRTSCAACHGSRRGPHRTGRPRRVAAARRGHGVLKSLANPMLWLQRCCTHASRKRLMNIVRLRE
eukprot:scaffold581406_cov38-Prasinocladus_malaysianus.AAC.1